ncbi:MAG TPA: sensor histidine kinase [Candidatus Limnocylindria bacterium]|nr:sensor histidine kinase [Candidatus Limnocylindria bacterium]
MSHASSTRCKGLLISLGWLAACVAVVGENSRLANGGSALEIRSTAVDGESLLPVQGERLQLPFRPKLVSFGFGPTTNAGRGPIRIRYTLDGADEIGREKAGEVRFSVRFFDSAADQVAESVYRAFGQSPGWTENLESCRFVHRRESMVVPPKAQGFWIVMSSAGPPVTVGAYAITNISVSITRTGETNATPIVQWPPPGVSGVEKLETERPGWIRDGLSPSMAKIVEFGPDGESKAFYILDDNVIGHAEWHTRKDAAPPVSPGDRLTVNWDEAYSVGEAGSTEAIYTNLPAGYYRLRINRLNLKGTPTEGETSLALSVPAPFWETPWFWVSIGTLAVAAWAGSWRVVVRRRMQSELQRLEHLRMLERERLRIAQDIHDDLGARVTQISLMSAMAQRKASLPDEARADFGIVSQMTRDLVGALYETVWAVNPENDHLDALASYLCQVANQLCTTAELPCRLDVGELPATTPLDSHVRHNLLMAAKEAINNVIKHAQAREVRVSLAWKPPALDITIADNGIGFDPEQVASHNGLSNMKRRMESNGGTLEIRSVPSGGTEVRLRQPLSGSGVNAPVS